MPCRHVHRPGGGYAIVCGPRVRRSIRRCVVCNCPDTMATMKLCDYPLQDKLGRTCDAPVCVEHAMHVEPDTDYCPQHAPTGEETRYVVDDPAGPPGPRRGPLGPLGAGDNTHTVA
jgi:hypothetical protein